MSTKAPLAPAPYLRLRSVLRRIIPVGIRHSRVLSGLRKRIGRPRSMFNLVAVPCVLCGSKSFSPITPNRTAPVVRCGYCGFLYVNRQPSESDVRSYYELETQEGYTRNIRQWQREQNARMEKVWIEDMECLSPWLPPQAKTKGFRFLDAGCATGFQLVSATERGWDAWGIELSEPIALELRTTSGLQVINGTIEDGLRALGADNFSLVLMSHVLEHMPKPRSAVEAAYRLLKPGGLIAIYVPNGEGLQARHDFEGWEWSGFPDHLWFFSSMALRRLLVECGFQVEGMWTCVGHSDAGKLYDLVKEQLHLDNYEQAGAVAEVLGPMGLLSDLRIVARKPIKPMDQTGG